MPIARCFKKSSGTEVITVDKIVEVPVETIVEVPVEVPVPYEVQVQVPVPFDQDLLGVIDFSLIQDTDLNTNGDFTIPVQNGKYTNNCLLRSRYTENLQGGYQNIQGGVLSLKSGEMTSVFGADYWSTLVTPYLSINLADFIPAQPEDPYYEARAFEVTFEFEPVLKDDVYQGAETYVYLNLGITTGLDRFENIGEIPNGIFYNERPTNTTNKANMLFGAMNRATTTNPASTPGKSEVMVSANSANATYNPPAFYSSFFNTTANKAVMVSRKYPISFAMSNGSAVLSYCATYGNAKNSYGNGFTSQNNRRDDQTHIYISLGRSFSTNTALAGRTVKKITIRERKTL